LRFPSSFSFPTSPGQPPRVLASFNRSETFCLSYSDSQFPFDQSLLTLLDVTLAHPSLFADYAAGFTVDLVLALCFPTLLGPCDRRLPTANAGVMAERGLATHSEELQVGCEYTTQRRLFGF
jgi:hypothetical protein